MQFWQSFWYFVWGTIKRLWALLPAFLADPFDIAERWFRVTYQPPDWIFWPLLVLGLLFAAALTYHELRMQKVELEKASLASTTRTVMGPRAKRLYGDDYSVLVNLCEQARSYGHNDDEAIKRDLLHKVDPNVILKRDCTHCGKPRNRAGGCYE